jgi:hypothetical protein
VNRDGAREGRPDAREVRLEDPVKPTARPIRGAIVATLLAAIALLLPAGAQAAVYWGAQTTIGHANNDGTGVNQSFISGADGACGVTVDGAHVYWANFANHTGTTIGRANLDGTGVNQGLISGAHDPCGVAVDGSHVYWANVAADTIGRAKLDGTGVNQSFIQHTGRAPCGVAVDGSHLYWANHDVGTIGRANLNGTAVNNSLITGASFPCGVAVNAAHVYWANLGGSTIGRAKLDGTGVNQSFINSGGQPCGVAVDAAHVYWANSNDVGTIGRANLNGTGVNTSFISGAVNPCGVAVDSLTNRPPPHQPDGLIKRSTDASYIGDGIYNTTAAGQTKTSRARRGEAKVFDLKLQNDGDTSDALKAKGCESSTGFRVSYRRGSTDVTQQVTSGAFSTGTLAPGAARRLTLRVKVKGNAAHGAVKSCLLTASTLGDPPRKDAVEGRVAVVAPPAGDCQPFAKRPCLLPFPNDLFTKRDPSTPTGRRVHLPQGAMPTNTQGSQVKVAEYDRNDGFSPGSAIVVRVPGLDNPRAFEKTNPVSLTDMSKALRPGAPIVVIDARTGKRQLIWAELDSNASDASHTTLLIHPGENLAEGHRYIVAMRHLKDKHGKPLSAPGWFQRLRDRRSLPRRERSQRSRYRRIFRALKEAGIGRHSLYEAWDFTVESRHGLSSRLLHIRNDAFAQLGDTKLADGRVQGNAPQFHVDNVQSDPAPGIAKFVTGTFTVPCYLTTHKCAIGGGFNYASKDPDALPSQKPGNLATPHFYCIVPTAASGANPARALVFGHGGVAGSGSSVASADSETLASEHNLVTCATDWWGFTLAPYANDVPFDIRAAQDLNLAPRQVDRVQQGVLNTLYLGRLMRTADGFASDPAFQQSGTPVFDTSQLYYHGISNGGNLGGLATAVAPDFTRAALVVGAMNFFGLMAPRSTSFTGLASLASAAYPDSSIHPLLFDLVQQLWDRGDPDGYAAHMTSDPLPDTPSHAVLMQIAYGDFSESNYASAVEARTIGASAHTPALDAGRIQDQHLLYGVPAIPSYPFNGSAIVIWDSGPGLVDPPPLTNTPPSGPHNPHYDLPGTVAARTQISRFLKPSGAVTDVCGGAPCHSDSYTP